MIINVSWGTFFAFFSHACKNVDLHEFIVYFLYFVKKELSDWY